MKKLTKMYWNRMCHSRGRSSKIKVSFQWIPPSVAEDPDEFHLNTTLFQEMIEIVNISYNIT